MENSLSRRKFIGAISAATLGVAASGRSTVFAGTSDTKDTLAILGGKPVRQNKSWPLWPQAAVNDTVVQAVEKVIKSGAWVRFDGGAQSVLQFEKDFAAMLGAKYCVTTGAGTQSLQVCVETLGIAPGDEVITSPYTDFGTISSILCARALPVMVDLDRDSFQNDPAIIEKRINANTKAIMPVHIMGQPCDMDSIMAIAKKHNLPVIEDACQAHLAEHRGKKLGTIGTLGCFSHQGSKVIGCGEGGSIVGDDDDLMEQIFTVMNKGASRKGVNERIGNKCRMHELEGALLVTTLATAKDRWKTRDENAKYLSSKLKACPGVIPQKLYPGFESGAWWLYAMSYRKEHFNNVSRAVFIKALAAEGISFSSYIRTGLHREPWVDHMLGLKVYQQNYSLNRLKQYREELACPVCDKICDEEMLIFNARATLLATRADMDDVANAVMKLYENRDQLTKVTV